MDYQYLGELALSMVIFAPGVVLLTVLLFVGLLMMLEKAGVFGTLAARREAEAEAEALQTPAAANPGAGPIVDALKESVEAEQTAEQKVVNE